MRNKIAKFGIDSKLAYDKIFNLTRAETSPKFNLGSFSQIAMDAKADKLFAENLGKNASNKAVYEKIAEIEKICLDIISCLWHKPNSNPKQSIFFKKHGLEKPIGTSTVGSTEGCILAGLAMKMRWKKFAPQENSSTPKKPKLIIMSCFHACWEKFGNMCEVELDIIPVDAHHLTMNVDLLRNRLDNCTIGVVAILGNTYTGYYDDIQAMDKVVGEYNGKSRNKIYIHVDAASGGFFAPFVQNGLVWDFKLPNVASINSSGHKYGLVYSGIGWVIWRCEEFLPDELITVVEYTGGSVCSLNINFTKASSHIAVQYYQFLKLGFDGFRLAHLKSMDMANFLKTGLSEIAVNVNGKSINVFNVQVGDIPLVNWSLNSFGQKWSLLEISEFMHKEGWSIPAYPLENNLREVLIQRIVCRADMNAGTVKHIIKDMKKIVKELMK